MLPQFVPSDESPAQIACDVLVVGAFATEPGFELDATAEKLDAELDGYLTEYLEDMAFKAGLGSVAVLPTMRRLPAKAVAIAGLGPRDRAGSTEVRRAAGASVRRLSNRSTIVSALQSALEEDVVSETAEGFLLGNYRFTSYRSDPNVSKVQRIVLPSADAASIERGTAIAEATALARDLANEPPSSLAPEAFARRATEIADVNGLECTVWDEDKLEDKGFGGLLGVARGSDRPPRFIELRYAPPDATRKVALVGKGVTFDSGGLSIKDAKSMETMKSDMSGAAAVIATMSVLKKLDVNLEVLAYVPATENMPSGHSIKPGDVIRHYDGKTTEVNNTDAEGRLILADALAYACEQKPDAIVDIATLTGAIMVALGKKAAGLFASDDALAEELVAAGRAGGERLWRMPLYEDYRQDLDSNIADIRNSGARWGGAIIAAIFLKEHVKKDIPWAHLDIAGIDWADKNSDIETKGATGGGTRTLVNWILARGT